MLIAHGCCCSEDGVVLGPEQLLVHLLHELLEDERIDVLAQLVQQEPVAQLRRAHHLESNSFVIGLKGIAARLSK